MRKIKRPEGCPHAPPCPHRRACKKYWKVLATNIRVARAMMAVDDLMSGLRQTQRLLEILAWTAVSKLSPLERREHVALTASVLAGVGTLAEAYVELSEAINAETTPNSLTTLH